MALSCILDPGFNFLSTRGNIISFASQLNTPIVMFHHIDNSMDTNNIPTNRNKNNGIVPTTIKNLWESFVEIEKSPYSNSAVYCCIGCTSGV